MTHPFATQIEGSQPAFYPLPIANLQVFKHTQSRDNLLGVIGHEIQGTVADLGCGVGDALPYLHQAELIVAVDRDAHALAQLRARYQTTSGPQVETLTADLAHYHLEQPADLSLLILALQPNTLQDMVRILSNVQSQTKPGKPVLLVLPSMEAQLYWLHLQYRFHFDQGLDETLLQERYQHACHQSLADAGPGGSGHYRCWSKEEIINLLMSLRFKPQRLEKHYLPWRAYFPGQHWYHQHRPLWHWRILVENP